MPGWLMRGRSASSASCSEFCRKSRRLHEGQLLHGELLLEIREARDLADTDKYCFRGCFGQDKDVTDPYVAVLLDHTRIITTSVVYNNLSPQWNECFRITVCHFAKTIVLRVKDQDELGTDHVGDVHIDVKELLQEHKGLIQGWHPLLDSAGVARGRLYFVLEYKPCLKEDSWLGLCSDCYFPAKSGNDVSLFSCAAANNNNDDDDNDDDDKEERPLWLSVFVDLINAEKFVYIAGWSIYVHLKLIREADRRLLRTENEREWSRLTLGELLKAKAESGVRVLLMIWGETTSIMGTFDTDTENFFKGSGVHVARVGRQTTTSEYKDLDAHLTANLAYSHHQKCIVTDVCEKNDERRRIVAYVGGIDLTKGRYDSPRHPLFPTSSTHKDDFYQPCFPNNNNRGRLPRMPWQDVHARLQGPAARDVMLNFVERWGKERPLQSRLLVQNVAETLTWAPLWSESTSQLPNSSDLMSSKSKTWTVQVYRSLTSDSARFQLESETCLTTKKGRSVDNSILRGYTSAIRKARRFIYMESQFFMGSSFSWVHNHTSVHCHNVLPMEITQRIIEAIEEDRSFVVYLVLPLHPEGPANDAAIQEMLCWQRRTLHMMYTRIAHALHQQRAEHRRVQDYLLVLSLAKKEMRPKYDNEDCFCFNKSISNEVYERFMIYVHSKLMIVDDCFVMVGSANINQRSLDGDRDSELAIGAIQPQYLPQKVKSNGLRLPKGEIAKFRTTLFKQHMGFLDPIMEDAGSLECVRLIRGLAEKNWLDFCDKNSQMSSHLMLYPIIVEVNVLEEVVLVNLKAATSNGCFPDTRAKILGKQAASIPNRLTC